MSSEKIICSNELSWFESQPFSSFWEKGYKDMSVSTMGGPNHDIVELCEGLPNGARVLDLGCGEGRNSFFLAGRGCEVTAVDRSAAGIKKLSALCKQEGYHINTVVSDIREFNIDKQYDVIMAHGVIDYLGNDEWRTLLSKIKAMTVPGGYNAYTCMIFNDQYPTPPEFKAAHFKHCLVHGELVEFYGDWNVVRYDYYVKWDQHPGIPLHCHPLEKIIVRKPLNFASNEPRVELVPIKTKSLSNAVFDKIYMDMPKDDLLLLCGQPDVIDKYSMDGVQLGVSSNITFDGYNLALWYYGKSWIYVINDIVWGKATSLSGDPVRIFYRSF